MTAVSDPTAAWAAVPVPLQRHRTDTWPPAFAEPEEPAELDPPLARMVLAEHPEWTSLRVCEAVAA